MQKLMKFKSGSKEKKVVIAIEESKIIEPNVTKVDESDDKYLDNRNINAIYFITSNPKNAFQIGVNKYIKTHIFESFQSYSFSIIAMTTVITSLEASLAYAKEIRASETISALICLSVIEIIFGLSVTLLNLYLGQFSGRNIFHCWNFFPLCKVFGLSMLFIAYLHIMYETQFMSFNIYYIIMNFYSTKPWTVCPEYSIEDMQCKPHLFSNTLGDDINSFEAFYLINALHYKNSSYSINRFILIENPYFIIIFIIYLISTVLVYLRWTFLTSMTYILLLYPLICLVILIIRMITLIDSTSGFYYSFEFFSIKLIALNDIHLWYESLKFHIISRGYGYGSILTLASHNQFQFPTTVSIFLLYIIEMAYLILPLIFIGFVTTYMTDNFEFHSGTFSGYENLRFYFVLLLELFSKSSNNSVFIFFLFSALIISSFARHLYCSEIILTFCQSHFPNSFIFTKLKLIIYFMLFIFFVLSSYAHFFFPHLIFYPFYYEDRSFTQTIIIILIQSVSLSFFYGSYNLIMDYKLINKAKIPYFFIYYGKFFIPIYCGLAIALYYEFLTKYFNETLHHIQWTIIFGVPLIYLIVRLSMYIKRGKFSMIKTNLLSQNLYWGPQYMSLWFKDIRYNYKLKHVLIDRFRKY